MRSARFNRLSYTLPDRPSPSDEGPPPEPATTGLAEGALALRAASHKPRRPKPIWRPSFTSDGLAILSRILARGSPGPEAPFAQDVRRSTTPPGKSYRPASRAGRAAAVFTISIAPCRATPTRKRLAEPSRRAQQPRLLRWARAMGRSRTPVQSARQPIVGFARESIPPPPSPGEDMGLDRVAPRRSCSPRSTAEPRVPRPADLADRGQLSPHRLRPHSRAVLGSRIRSGRDRGVGIPWFATLDRDGRPEAADVCTSSQSAPRSRARGRQARAPELHAFATPATGYRANHAVDEQRASVRPRASYEAEGYTPRREEAATGSFRQVPRSAILGEHRRCVGIIGCRRFRASSCSFQGKASPTRSKRPTIIDEAGEVHGGTSSGGAAALASNTARRRVRVVALRTADACSDKPVREKRGKGVRGTHVEHPTPPPSRPPGGAGLRKFA